MNSLRDKTGKFAKNEALIMPSKFCAECGDVFLKDPRYSMGQWDEQGCCGKACQYKYHQKLLISRFSFPEIVGIRSKTTKRLIRMRRNGGSHTKGEWETLKAQYNWTCQSCLKQEPEIILTRDHIIPVSRGGSDNIENIQPLCNPCNASKGSYV